MNNFEYGKKFKKGVTRNQLLDEINVTRDELTNNTVDFFDKTLKVFRRDDSILNSQLYQSERDNLISDFTRSGFLRGKNPIDMVYQSLENAKAILGFIESYIDKRVTTEVSQSSLTLVDTNVLQLLDFIGFASRYARYWIQVILSAESNHLNQLAGDIDATPYQIQWLGENRDAFGRVISLLATPVKRIESLLEDMPEIIIAEANPRALQATQGDKRIDPLKLGFVVSKWNPIWLYGIWNADRQVQRYKAAKDDKEVLEMMVMRLERQLQGHDDPRLHQIYLKRLAQLEKERGKLKDMEEA
jgi:hypothetical protein